MTQPLKSRLDSKFPCLICDYKRALYKLERSSAHGSAGFFLVFGGAEYNYVSTNHFQCIACGFKFQEDKWTVEWPCSYCGEYTQVYTETSGIDLIQQIEKGVLCYACESFLDDYQKDGCTVCHNTETDKIHHPRQIQYMTLKEHKRFLRGTITKKEYVRKNVCSTHINQFKNRDGFQVTEGGGTL